MATPDTPLSLFLPYVLPHAMKVPEPVAEFNLRLAAIEFCERTRCWRHAVSVAVSSNNQTLVAPAFTTIHQFEEATHDGRLLIPTQYTSLPPEVLSGELATGLPTWISQTEPGQVTIHPYLEGTLRLTVFLKPRHGTQFGADATNPLRDALNIVPAFMLSQHAEALACGALARILAIPGKPWSDPQRAMYHKAEFDKACDGSFSSNMTGQQRAPLRTKGQYM